MFINDELHESIVEKVSSFLKDQNVSVEENIFNGLIKSFEEIVSGFPETKIVEIVVDKVNVRYVGPEEHYSDSLYNTGNWKKAQVKLVAESVAAKMFLHPDVYVPVSPDEIISDEPENIVVVEQSQKIAPDFDPELQDLRDSVSAMTRKAAVSDFVARNFNGLLIPTESSKDLSSMKQFALTQIDAFHVPGVGDQ